MNKPRDDHLRRPPARAIDREELLAPQTQLVADREDYLGQGRNDVGRRIADDQVELFISADIAGSLQQEFTQHAPEFVAVHDVGSSASLRLLSSLAGAAGARVQKLSIRRQGHGVALAVLQFVEVPQADGQLMRVYSTDLSADNATRSQVARVLLAFSRLGVMLVGELPPNALGGQLAPFKEALARGPWPNRDLLLVPLGSSGALAAQAAQLAGQSAVEVHVAPQATRPQQVWAFIGGAWNRQQARSGGDKALQTDIGQAAVRPSVPASEAATQPMGLDPVPPHSVPPDRLPPGYASAPPVLPAVAAATPMPVPGGTRWQAYADRCALIKGTQSCCVFDLHSSKPLAHAGGQPAAERMAQQGALLLGQMNEVARAMGLGSGRAEATLSTSSHHLLIRPVPGHPGIAVHLVVSATVGNLTLARMQLERIEAPQ